MHLEKKGSRKGLLELYPAIQLRFPKQTTIKPVAHDAYLEAVGRERPQSNAWRIKWNHQTTAASKRRKQLKMQPHLFVESFGDVAATTRIQAKVSNSLPATHPFCC